MNIRPAQDDDLDTVAALHRAAFSASPMGHRGEAELVWALHAEGDVVASLLAERDGEFLGHVMFSSMYVEADGKPLRAAALAPLAVRPDEQRNGIGAALIRAGLTRLRDEGVQISFVLGHAVYYPRFGYRPDLAMPYISPFGGPHFMAVHLDSGLALPQRGRADYAPAFARMG
jgi:putative acetyltransferase